MANGSRRARAAAAIFAGWVAVLSTLAGYAQTDDQRLTAVVLTVLTAGVPALALKKSLHPDSDLTI